MRQTILIGLFALLAVGVARDAGAQRRGGVRRGFTRSGYGFSHNRPVSRYGFGYGYLPYDFDTDYPSEYQPDLMIQQPYLPVQPTAQPVVAPPVHPVITEYKWPAADAASSATPESEPQSFAIVLKDGTTLSAVSVFASEDGLHYVDPDERHLRISISEVDRAATLKLNRARNLNLYLPAAQ
jgi:hypothetical protein